MKTLKVPLTTKQSEGIKDHILMTKNIVSTVLKFKGHKYTDSLIDKKTIIHEGQFLATSKSLQNGLFQLHVHILYDCFTFF